MSKKSGARLVVLAALAGNVAIAVLKFGAFGFTGSTALLTEGIHSLVDTVDQGFLLIGQARAKRKPNDAHPFGYGMEVYFWGFVVALMVFFAGGAAAIWEGVEKLLNPGEVTHPAVNLLVIAIAALFEALSFRTAYREYRRVVRGRSIQILKFVTLSKDPSLFATILEDLASMIGLAIAAGGVIGTAWLGLAWADPAASVAIGVLLLAMAVLMANETRSLIAGEAAAPPIVERARKALEKAGVDGALASLRTLHLGPDTILAAVDWRFGDKIDRAEMDRAVQALSKALRKADSRITEVMFAVEQKA